MNEQSCLLVATGVYNSTGGIAKENRLVIQALLEGGYLVDILVLGEKSKSIQTNQKIRKYRVFNGNKFIFTLAVWKQLITSGYKYVICDHVNLSSILAIPGKLGVCKYIVWLNGVEVFPPRPDFEGKIGFWAAWKRLAISEYTARKVMENFPGYPIKVCELALDISDCNELNSKLSEFCQSPLYLQSLDNDSHTIGDQAILMVGRMESNERYKGQSALIKAFSLVHEYYPESQLIIAGGGDDLSYYRNLSKQILPNATWGNVFFPGYVSQDLLEKLYQRCAIFAMPSTGEGFGLVYLEAMSFAKPCIASRNDAASGIVCDGVNGFLVDDPDSPEELAKSIIELLSKPDQADKMGLAGYQLINSKYLFPHFKQRFLTILTI